MLKRKLFIALTLLLLALTVVRAQESTAEAPIPTATFTDTPSLTPSLTPTYTETVAYTETPSVTPTLSETPISTQIPEATSELFTPSETPTSAPLVSATPSATGSPLTLLVSDNFDMGTTNWTLGTGWQLVASEGGQALHAAGGQAAQLYYDDLANVVVQLRVLLSEGAVQLSVRDSGNSGYAVLLRADGQVGLFLNGVLLQSASTVPVALGQWRDLEVSALDDKVRVIVDGVEVMTFTDAAPLPAGSIILQDFGTEKSGLLIDDFMLWGQKGDSLTTNPSLVQMAESETIWCTYYMGGHGLPDPGLGYYTISSPPGNSGHNVATYPSGATGDYADAIIGGDDGLTSQGAILDWYFPPTSITYAKMRYQVTNLPSSPTPRTSTISIDNTGALTTVASLSSTGWLFTNLEIPDSDPFEVTWRADNVTRIRFWAAGQWKKTPLPESRVYLLYVTICGVGTQPVELGGTPVTATQTPTATPSGQCTATVNSGGPNVNVHNGAGLQYPVIGSIANGNQYQLVGRNAPTDPTRWYLGIGNQGPNNTGSPIAGWIIADLLEISANCNIESIPYVNNEGATLTPTFTASPAPPTLTPTPSPTATPTIDPNAPNPFSVEVEITTNRPYNGGASLPLMNGSTVVLGEGAYNSFTIIPYRTEVTVKISVKNNSGLGFPDGAFEERSFVSFGAPLDEFGRPMEVGFTGLDFNPLYYANRVTWGLNEFLSPDSGNFEPNEVVTREVKIRFTSTQPVLFDFLLSAYLPSTIGSYDDFSTSQEYTIDLPMTYMGFDPSETYEFIEAAMFWILWNETSQGNWYNFDLTMEGVGCSEVSNPGWGSNHLITKIQHGSANQVQAGTTDGCFDYRYMFAQTILNGLLNWERTPNFQRDDLHPARAFGYVVTNFKGSLGKEDYVFWTTHQLCFPTFAQVGIPNPPEGLTVNDRVPYKYVLADVGKTTGNWTPAMLWLHNYLTCVETSREGQVNNGDTGLAQAFVNFHTNTLPLIEAAITDFTAEQPDPTGGAFSILAGNSAGAGVGFKTLIDESLRGIPYEQLTPAQQDIIEARYPAHIDKLKTEYGPNWPSVIQPVVWAERNLDSNNIFVRGSYFWVSPVYQQAANQYHSPR